MFERILVVCDGNICRSPTVAAMLAAARPEKRISSAGLVGLEGHDMEPTAREVAAAQGLGLLAPQGLHRVGDGAGSFYVEIVHLSSFRSGEAACPAPASFCPINSGVRGSAPARPLNRR